jgi:protein-disulfide isomerase/uncharacterized membrane protein
MTPFIRTVLVVTLLMLAGAGLSVYYLLHQWLPGGGGLCGISETINCSASASSAFAYVGPVPVALLGLAFYLASLTLLRPLQDGENRATAPMVVLQSLLLASVAYSVLLATVTAVFIQTLCPVCTLMWLVNILGLVAVRRFTGMGLFHAVAGQFRAFVSSVRVLVPWFIVVFVVVLSSGMYVQTAILAQTTELPEPYLTPEQVGDFERLRRPDGPGVGPVDAPIVIVEFSDFQCPFCSRLADSLHTLQTELGDDVRIEFRNLPLAMHPFAEQAALAGICAWKEDKFWELHDLLFANGPALSSELILELGAEVGLDEAALQSCMNDPTTQERLQQDRDLAAELELRGTPVFIINGTAFAGGYPAPLIRRLLPTVQ